MTELNIEAIESKLKALKSIGEIVGSMKALSAHSIRKAEGLLPHLRTYAENIEDSLAQILHYFPEAVRVDFEGEGQKACVVFTSEQGLCGVFNERIVNEAEGFLDEKTVGLILSGRKGIEEAESRGLPVILSLSSPVSVEAVDIKVMNLATELFTLYSQRYFQQLYLLFAYYRRRSDYLIIRQRVLPPPFKRILKRTKKKRAPLVYMAPEDILEDLMRQYLIVALYKAFIESLASENASRMLSMERASRNIDEKFAELSELYNYLRQEEITNETIEITSGFEAIRK